MKKFFVFFMAIAMVAALSASAFTASAAVAPSGGTVTVASRYNDGSVKEVTIKGWEYVSYATSATPRFSGNLNITFPKGYTKNTPTVEECWVLMAPMVAYYDGATKPAPTPAPPALTSAQQEAVSQMQAVRQSAEGNGWAVEWWPSQTVAATATKAWYACEASQLAGDNISTYRFSVLTEKVGNGWKTSFKTYQNGKVYSSQTPLEVTNMLAKTTATKALQANIVRATNAQSAVSSYIQYLESRGYMTTVISSSTSDTLVNLTWYSTNKGYDVRITPEARGDGTYRIHVADLTGIHTYTLKEILTFSFN